MNIHARGVENALEQAEQTANHIARKRGYGEQPTEEMKLSAVSHVMEAIRAHENLGDYIAQVLARVSHVTEIRP